MRFRTLFLGLAACLGLPGEAAAQDVDVDLELVLAVDVSRSMDPAEQELQKQGYIAALQHPDVLQAIREGLLGRIAVAYAEWAGPGMQRLVAPWTLIDGAGTANAFTAIVAAQPVAYLHGTSISGGLLFASGQFEGNGFRSPRQVIDVSGDGPNNMGLPVLAARELVLGRGITINGLPIMLHADYFSAYSIPNLDVYYEQCVIGGPGAFLITVHSMERIAEAIRRKLVQEIAGASAKIVPADFPAFEAQPRIDCQIGEKLRRRWSDP
jgi:hypothetical protein